MSETGAEILMWIVFFSFASVIKTMLEIEEIAVDDFSDAHNIYAKLRHEPPLPFKKNLHPYPLGRRVSDTNSWVKDRCFTPYNVIVYSIKLNFQQNLMLTHPPWLSCLFLNQTTSHQQNFIFARITQIVTKNTASSRNFQQYHVFLRSRELAIFSISILTSKTAQKVKVMDT